MSENNNVVSFSDAFEQEATELSTITFRKKQIEIKELGSREWRKVKQRISRNVAEAAVIMQYRTKYTLLEESSVKEEQKFRNESTFETSAADQYTASRILANSINATDEEIAQLEEAKKAYSKSVATYNKVVSAYSKSTEDTTKELLALADQVTEKENQVDDEYVDIAYYLFDSCIPTFNLSKEDFCTNFPKSEMDSVISQLTEAHSGTSKAGN